MDTNSHPMLPGASHDEAAEQLFVRDLKVWLTDEVEPYHREQALALDPGPGSNARVETLYERLHEDESFRAWAGLRRTAQEMLWTAIGESVGRQADGLEARGAEAPELGSVTLDPDFVVPEYLADRDVHMMPGGYAHEDGGLLQGAVMDRGGAVYMLGRNGGLMNDVRGHTLVSHLYARFSDLAPARVLELGCGIGASLVPVATAFPEAEVHGIDVGASMLRYGLARARHLGVAVHLRQGDAEAAPYPDESFDLIFSCVLLHETSPEAIARIMAESHRLLRPGGVVAHLEVPMRYEAMDLWGKIRGEMEYDYNNEPNWKAAISADYKAELVAAGFRDVETGYQAATAAPVKGAGGFSDTSQGVFRSWFVASARK
ncbi:class I SAM-dependent methyltransferase [Polymorphobacter sp.]|uniref:class I SAM-dependent methyltransferase n=1 Tax=Polymorphobacter sp. TaxID=1909290 RepID=UPI003F72B68B